MLAGFRASRTAGPHARFPVGRVWQAPLYVLGRQAVADRDTAVVRGPRGTTAQQANRLGRIRKPTRWLRPPSPPRRSSSSSCLSLQLPLSTTSSLSRLLVIGLLAIVTSELPADAVRVSVRRRLVHRQSRENLGTGPSLVAAASLMVDYTLTVSVWIAAGVAAVTLQPFRACAVTRSNLRSVSSR